MTVAAGFVTHQGVLLAAATLHQGPGYKLYDNKMRWFECPLVPVGFAYAGNVPPARVSTAACRKKLHHDTKGDLVELLEEILAAEYTRRLLAFQTNPTIIPCITAL